VPILISIIIPLYNAEKYISELINNLTKNTVITDEVVFVNDGSKDNTLSLVNDLAIKLDCSYKIINQENNGQSSARNIGLINSLNDWVCFIDCDDYLDQNFLTIGEIISRNNYVDFIVFDFTVLEENLLLSSKTRKSIGNIIYEVNQQNKNSFINKFLSKKIKIHNSAIIYKRKYLYDNNIRFNERTRFGEDSIFIWESIIKSKTFIYYKMNIYFYISRISSVIKSSSVHKINFFLTEFIEMFKGNKSLISDTTITRITSNYYISCARVLSKHYTKNSFVDFFVANDIHKIPFKNVYGHRFIFMLFIFKYFRTKSYYIIGGL
jgi:glycosyltransferase involved in cell wall biosynthesis